MTSIHQKPPIENQSSCEITQAHPEYSAHLEDLLKRSRQAKVDGDPALALEHVIHFSLHKKVELQASIDTAKRALR
jgi:hypothetical protein